MDFIRKNIRRINYYLALAKANSYYAKEALTPSSLVNKHVYFELDQIDYHRYFYVLVIFYRRAEYTVFIKASKKSIARIIRDKYAQKLLLDNQVIFVKSVQSDDFSKINFVQLTPSYFENTTTLKYHIPMCQHPTMYDQGIDNLQFEPKRYNSLGFAGDFRVHLYGKSELKESFEHLNRIEMFAELEQTNRVVHLSSNHNQNFKEHLVYIIDNASVHLEPKDYRMFISQFDFFLALPGIHMPLSHNIIETMSLGTIPFVHKSYAKHMHPPLEHMKTAFIYDDFRSLNASISSLFQIEDSMIEAMRKEVLAYYNKYLTPSAVIQNIEKHKGSEIALNAEWNSINLDSETT
ncbi:MAG: hypothetical protein HKP14_11835 [Bacteroidia bacterium]|nr:hypothetical protein [Bacteroidia bacterium]